MIINTDEEMKEVEELIGQLGSDPQFETENIYSVVNLITGEDGPETKLDNALNERITKAKANRETILIKKKCPNPTSCLYGDEEWHDCLVITKGQIFMSMGVVDSIMDKMLRLLFGG